MSRVAPSYVDALGVERAAAPDTIARFEALVAPESHRFVPPSVVVRDGEPVIVDVVLPALAAGEPLQWRLHAGTDLHEGTVTLRSLPVVAHAEDGGIAYETRRLTLDLPLPLGRHRLDLAVDAFARDRVHVVIVPQRAYAPQGRTWGISLHLYALRSQRNAGIGDFGDLRRVCTLLGARGASYVGINPLHAPFRSDPAAASPYAASSRLRLNWLAIALDDVPEARAARVRTLLDDSGLQAEAQELRAVPLVDYPRVAALKERVLRACFAALPHDLDRTRDFDAWCAAEGERLARFAVFEVLVDRYGRSLNAWPATLRTPGSPDVALFAAANDDDVRYAMYLQWLAEEQLAAVAREGARCGVRLYRDLALGVDAGAADVWTDAGAYVRGVVAGAPPDEMNPSGQAWGLPPLDPRTLEREGYASLLNVLAANCRDAGALRIDHAFSLARLFWIPAGEPASAGTYVRYPLDALRGVVALASVQERCVAIGEDLGTVPEGFRAQMEATGILSYRVLLFERNADATFRAPEAYPALALAVSGTHDLPTLPAWLAGEDIALRERLGVLGGTAEAERLHRVTDRERFLDALVAHGDLRPEDRGDAAAVVIAANRYLAATPCAIVMAQLDDVLGERLPLNVPGTADQYPNWRRKLGTEIDALEHDERLIRVCTVLNELRPRSTS